MRMKMIRQLIGKLLCKIGRHAYAGNTVLADLDTYWVTGGEVCTHCGAKSISLAEAQKHIAFAYERGKRRSETHFLAYGNGIKKIVALYGKEYVQNLIAKEK